MSSLVEVLPGKSVTEQILLLPYRDLKVLRWLGIFGILGAMVQISFGLTFAGGAISMIFFGGNPPAPLPMKLFSIPFIAAGVWICWSGLRFGLSGFGMLLNKTRTRIEIRDRQIICREYFGPISFKRQVLLEPDYLLIVNAFSRYSTHDSMPSFAKKPLTAAAKDLFYLSKKNSNSSGQEDSIVVGYTQEVIEQVKKAITDFAPSIRTSEQADNWMSSMDSSVNAHVPDNEASLHAAKSIVYPKPHKTRIQCEKQVEGVIFQIPAQGLIRGSHGLFVFALIWMSLSSFMLFMMVLDMKKANFNIYALLFMIPFELIGIALLVASIYLSQRSTTVASSDGLLMISEKTIFGKKHKEWEESTLHSIAVAPSSISVNDQPVMELQISEIGGEKFKCLNFITTDELNWVVWELNNSLQIHDALSDSSADATTQHISHT